MRIEGMGRRRGKRPPIRAEQLPCLSCGVPFMAEHTARCALPAEDAEVDTYALEWSMRNGVLPEGIIAEAS